jgi:hypothetical protein
MSAVRFWFTDLFVWFIALSVAGVLLVFRDPRLDHRLVAVGSVLPLGLDMVFGLSRGYFGASGPFHALVTLVCVLVVVMAASINQRARRKNLLALVIGGFGHLVLDGAWLDKASFLWPITRTQGQIFSTARLQVWQRPMVVTILMEVIGLAVGMFLYQRCRLSNPKRRAALFKSGSLELFPSAPKPGTFRR